MVDPLTGMDPTEEVRALLLLEAIPGVGLRRLRALVDAFGSGTAALRAPVRGFARFAGRRAAEARGDRERAAAIDTALERGRTAGVVALSWADPRYPARLLHLADPPPVLFARGDLTLLGRGGVTVIGSRRATGRGRDVAAGLADALARRGICVISGLALGIDGAAHRGALAADGPTVAVLGSGVDRPSPGSHAHLARRISEHGLLVGEFLPGTPPRPHHFPRRNRVLAALADAVVVVEAGVRSGTLITVEHALDLGIEVFAVPGARGRPACQGSNRLLEEGAQPLTDVGAFAEARRTWDSVRASSGSSAPSHVPMSAASALLVAPVLEIVAGGAATVEEVIARSGLEAGPVVAVLCELEILGRVERGPGERYRHAS